MRAVDMEERLRPYRRASFVVLAIALLLCGHWVGWWELIPLAVAVVGFLIVDRSLATAPRPEFTIAAAWLLSEFAIAGSIALTGGPRSPALAWLVIPLVTLPARFNSRAVAAGLGVASVLLGLTTFGIDTPYIVDHPQSIILPIGLMAAGSLIDAIGFASTMMLYVGVGLAALMAIAVHWRASAQRAQATVSVG